MYSWMLTPEKYTFIGKIPVNDTDFDTNFVLDGKPH